jgi:glycosyltransferase involved in cell wall biosynthesis
MSEKKINLVGWIDTENGIGVDIQCAADACKAANIPFNIINAAEKLNPGVRQIKNKYSRKTNNKYEGNIYLYFLDIVTAFRFQVLQILSGEFNWSAVHISVAPWELPSWPLKYKFAAKYFDYLFASTRFIEKAFAKTFGEKKIFYVKPSVRFEQLNLKQKNNMCKKTFVFLSIFDGLSSIGRKNVLGTIKAFKKFNTKYKNTKLILKGMNLEFRPKDFQKVKDYSFSKNIKLINEVLTKKQLIKIIKSSDCLISLHRSEGFGRNIADAMVYKIPVICSAFSGNLDFCNKRTAFLVSGKKIKVSSKDYSFSDNQKWFEPDINCAVKEMEKVYKNRFVVSKTTQNAFKSLYSNYNPKKVGHAYLKIFNKIRKKHNI